MTSRVYFYAESLSRSTTTTTDFSVVPVTKTFQPNDNKTYAIFWNIHIDGSATGAQCKVRLINTTASVTYAEYDLQRITATPSTDVTAVGSVALYTAGASPAQQTIQIQVASSTGSLTTGYSEACMLILELTDADVSTSSTGESTSASATYATKVTLSVTPPSAGDYLVVISAGWQSNAIGVDPQYRLNVNSGTFANTLDAGYYIGHANTYYCYTPMYRLVNVSTAQTVAVQYASKWATASATIRHCYCVALRLDTLNNRYWAEDRTVHTSTSSTYADSATTGAITPAAVAHAVMACGITTDSNATEGSDATGQKINGAGTDINTTIAQNRAQSGFWANWFSFRVITPAASSQTWKTQYARTAGADTVSSDEHVIAVLQLEDEASGSTERWAPDSIAASTNLTGAVTDIDDDPDSPDANWLTATSATAATDVRVTFPTPTGDPIGTQNFRAQLRKTTGATTPTVDVMLYQGGSSVATLLNDTSITSTSGQVVQGDWNANQLTGTLDGSDVECRIVSTVGSTTGAGALPALSATTGTGLSSTSPWTNQTLNMPAHAVGDLLLTVVISRNTTNDGVLTSVNGTGGTTGWTLVNNSGSGYGGAQVLHVAGFGWKIATSTSEVCSITNTGTGTDRYNAMVFKFTATNGFAATAVTSVGSPTTGSGTSLGMPSVAAGGTNELAVAIYGIAANTTVANATGETGGDWAETPGEYAIGTTPTVTLGIQTSDQSGGGAISGGTATLGSTGVWCALGFRVIPAQVTTNVNTVEVGAIEWNAQYTPPTGGQPMIKRFGGIPFVCRNKGVW